MEEYVLQAKGLCKVYSGLYALDELDLSLPKGKIVGLLGPNGSGKTTFIKLAAGLLQPTRGSITISGNAVGPQTKAAVSYLPDRPCFRRNMKVKEMLDFMGDFYADFDRSRGETMLGNLDIDPDARFRTLSKGTQEKVQLVLTMSRRAKLYLLDEPIGGVDPAARDYILNTIITNYDPEATILISTHLIADVEAVLDEFLFLHNGRIIKGGNADTVREETGKSLDQYFREVFVFLKHEWRSTRGILGLLCIIILSSGVAIGGSGFYMAWTAENRFVGNDSVLTALMSILLLAAIVVIAVCCAGGVFFFIWRFYRSRFTDEGYLTFTLPVTTHQNLLSSIINTLLSCVLIGIAASGAFIIAFGLLILAYNQEIIWQDTFYAIRHFWPDVVAMFQKNWQNFLLFGGCLVSTGISKVILLMLAVTIGSVIAKKHKILTAVGAYWLISLVRNTVFAVGLVTSSSEKWLFQYPFYTGIAVTIAGYFLMHYLVDRKLNLN